MPICEFEVINTMETTLIAHVCECKQCLAAVLTQAEPGPLLGCEHYRDLLADLKQEDKSKEPIAHVVLHPADEFIEEYCFSRLSQAAKLLLEKHMTECAVCRKRVTEHQQFVLCMKHALEISHASSSKVNGKVPQRFSSADLIAVRSKLPVSPTTGLQAFKALQNDTADLRDIEAIVNRDPVLAAHLIKVANSALFSYGQEIRSVSLAIARIGFDRTKLHVWGLSVKRFFSSPHLNRIWDHSIQTAQIVRQLCEISRVMRPDEGGLIALVHDIGQVVLAALGKPFEAAAEELRRRGAYPLQIERQLCGTTHAEIGADLLESWHFPRDMVEAVRFHHAPSGSGRALASLLYVAESWLENAEDVYDQSEHLYALKRLKLNKTDLEHLANPVSPDLELLRFAA